MLSSGWVCCAHVACAMLLFLRIHDYIYTQTPKTERSNAIGLDRKHMCHGGDKAAAAAAAAGGGGGAAAAAAAV